MTTNPNTSSANNNTTTYPHPIPSPPIDLTFPSLAAGATYLHGFAANHGFKITTLDTRLPTSIQYKCSLGDHRHTTKAKTQAKTQAQETQSTSSARLLKTCPFKIICRRNRKDHNSFYLIFQDEKHSHHNHHPREGPPKRITFIPSLPQPQPQPTTSTSLPDPSIQLLTLPLAIPDPLSAGLLNHQYRLLLQEMQSLPTANQTYLLGSFLRDVEFAKAIASSTTLAPIQTQRTPYPALLSTSAEVDAEDKTSKGKHSMTNIPIAPTLSSPAASSSIPNPKISPSLDVIESAIQSSNSPSPDSSTRTDMEALNLSPSTLPKTATSPVQNLEDTVVNHPKDHISTHSPSHQDSEEHLCPIPPEDIVISHLDSAASNSEIHPTENPSSPLPEFKLDIPMEEPEVEAKPLKNQDLAVSGVNCPSNPENHPTENRSSPLPDFNLEIAMDTPEVKAEHLNTEVQKVSAENSVLRAAVDVLPTNLDQPVNDIELPSVLPLAKQIKAPKSRTRKRKISKAEDNPAPSLRTRKAKTKEPGQNICKGKTTTIPDLPKLPKGYGYIEVSEEVESVEQQNDSVPTEEKAQAVGRGRKRKDRGPILPLKVSTRRKVAAAAKEELRAESETPRETEVPLAASAESPSTSAETTAAKADVFLPRAINSTQPTSKGQSLKPQRLLEKKKCQKPFTPEEMEEHLQIECVVLKKWPFLQDVPQYIFPFVKNATDVPKDGLCAFSTIAVSLGLTPNQAPTIRSVLLQHLQSKYDWYAENILKFAVDIDITLIESILKSTALTAEQSEWFPMPCGGFIIANAYRRPVIYYSKTEANCSLILPCFAPYCHELKDNECYQPIVMAFINENHFIPLELDFNHNLPIPFIHPDWMEVREFQAHTWWSVYEKNIIIYLNLKWQRDWITNRDGSYSRRDAIEVEPEEIEDEPEEMDAKVVAEELARDSDTKLTETEEPQW